MRANEITNGRGRLLSHQIFADIGNTHFHIYNGKKVEHLSYADAIEKYKDKELLYISVKQQLLDKIAPIKRWKNISSLMTITGEYETMGVDRKALCLSHDNGVFIDAGSAITVDVVEQGVYQGGFILPGVQAYVESYRRISPVLDMALDKSLSLESLPKTTKEQISYGIIASIKALIDTHSIDKKLYFTGGDGQFLSTYFDNAIYDEMLVFNGMQEALEDR